MFYLSITKPSSPTRRFLTRGMTALTLLVALAYGPTAHAQLLNGSFETGNFTGVNPQAAAGATQLFSGAINIDNWTTVNAELAWIGAGNPYAIVAPNGTRSLDLSGYHDGSPFGGVTQTITTQPGATYNLSFMIGVFGGNTNSITATVAGVPTLRSFTGPAGGNQWGTVGFNFVASSANTAISLIGQTATSQDYIGLDNVTVTLVQAANGPEPGTMALLITGGVGFLLARRKRVLRSGV